MVKISIGALAALNGVPVASATDRPDPPASTLAHILHADDSDRPPGQSEQINSAILDKSGHGPPNIPYRRHPDLMPPAAAAAYLGVKESTLAVWRCTKRYPLPFVKVGRLVQYRKSALDAFLASRTVEVSE
jgi:excisionase family DNA binding protein